MKIKRQMKITGKPPLTIFLNKRLCRVRSNALVMSMAQVNTSEPFLRYQSTVSNTAQVHMVVEQPA